MSAFAARVPARFWLPCSLSVSQPFWDLDSSDFRHLVGIKLTIFLLGWILNRENRPGISRDHHKRAGREAREAAWCSCSLDHHDRHD